LIQRNSLSTELATTPRNPEQRAESKLRKHYFAVRGGLCPQPLQCALFAIDEATELTESPCKGIGNLALGSWVVYIAKVLKATTLLLQLEEELELHIQFHTEEW
jgi:hypothetical protein